MSAKPVWEGEDQIPKDAEKVPVVKGDLSTLPKNVQKFILHWASVMKPKDIYISDGSKAEYDAHAEVLVKEGIFKKLTKLDECYACVTDPNDVARVEGKTFICTKERYDAVPHVAEGVQGHLAKWLGLPDLAKELDTRMPGCMAGRTMYVIPFSMGPLTSPLAKYCIELTDSLYVMINMMIMTRVSTEVFAAIEKHNGEFVRAVHSVGCPMPVTKKLVNQWPCNPEKTVITHIPEKRTIVSYGSGYGGNSLLGKKCLALRIAGKIAYDEGWMAEHMLIMSVTNPKGKEFFVTAAFPSACGKTNLAMLESVLPGYTIKTIGDDIAWMKFNEKGELRAINPEFGYFGVAPGTNFKSNPNAMRMIQHNTLFTNVALTASGDVYWQGRESEVDHNEDITTWMGEKWKIGQPGQPAHPNSRFTAPVRECTCLHPAWNDPEGVPISAIIFGGRRPEGVPLVIESRSWAQGVLLGAAVKSEATAAAEFKNKEVMHDPMAMRPFFGYNAGKYFQHWLDLEKPGRKMPKIFHVNWFRQKAGKFLWPGYCENVRVLDWITRRTEGEDIAVDTPVGLLPKKGSMNMDNLPGGEVDWDELFSLPKDYWTADVAETRKYFHDQVGSDMPKKVLEQLDDMEARFQKL
jgi:phosphoenolpyruvate carboxykinase (GTP)